MNEAKIESYTRFLTDHYPQFADKTRIISSDNIKTEWRTHLKKSGIHLYHDNIGNFTLEDGKSFNPNRHVFYTHQELFPDLKNTETCWRSMEIRETLHELLDRLEDNDTYKLAGISDLGELMNYPWSIKGVSKGRVYLVAGIMFVGERGYLNIPTVSNGKISPSPALHNPIKPNFSFIIRVTEIRNPSYYI